MKFPKPDISLLLILPMLLLSLAGQVDPWKEAPGHGHGKGGKSDKWEERHDDHGIVCRNTDGSRALASPGF